MAVPVLLGFAYRTMSGGNKRNKVPKRLSAVAFFACAIAMGVGYAVNGGDIPGTLDWVLAIAFTLVISSFVALIVWAFSRLIFSRKSKHSRDVTK